MRAPMSDKVEFFVVTLPGLEDLVEREVREHFPSFECKAEYGGVTVFAPLADGLAMNLRLKTPTRILVRVARFVCRDFPKLYQKVSNIPWKEWVNPSSRVEVHASSKKSRLKIKKRIEETCAEAWTAYQKKAKVSGKSKSVLHLYVRLIENECAVSLDTSGERLHKRGARQHIGEAPLRETIAAALLQMTALHADARPVELVDPMMGSGTFLLEAATRDLSVDQRHFAFEVFAQPPIRPPALSQGRPPFARLIGFETDEKTLRAAESNLRGVKAGEIAIQREDFFSARPLPPVGVGLQRWVVCNPPYGERLEVKGDLGQYYGRLFDAAEKVAHPDLACFLIPAKAVHGKFVLPSGWKVVEKRRFLNGGIPVVAFVFARIS